jgi:hypothetical protein
VTCNLTVTNSLNFEDHPNDVYQVSLGGVGNGDSTADAAEQTFMAVLSCDTVAAGGDGGTVATFAWKSALAASAHMDGTSTPVPMFFHIFVPNTADKGDNAFGLAGTITVTWSNLGDY